MRKSFFDSGTGLIILTMLLIVFCIVLMVFDYQARIPRLRNSLQTAVVLPIKQASRWPQLLTQQMDNAFTGREALQEENNRLKREITWLKASLANQSVLEAEYRRLTRLFESSANSMRPVMIAEVLDSHINASKHEIEINKGKQQDVFEGQVVIDENGLVGQVTRLTEQSAVVSLITDERQRIPVFIERNRLRMIARGSGDLGELEMEFVSKNADVRVGDKIVTSGLGGRYPRGYAVAIITAVDVSPANEFMQVQAKPLAALDKVLEVLLIRHVSTADDDAPFEETPETDAVKPQASIDSGENNISRKEHVEEWGKLNAASGRNSYLSTFVYVV